MLEVPFIEGEVHLEGRALGLDVTQNVQALLVPAEVRREDRREDHNEEAIWDVRNPRRTRLQSLLDFTQHHDDCECAKGYRAGDLACLGQMSEEEHDLVQAASMGRCGRMRGRGVEPHFGDELVDEYNDADCADETAQEWSAEDGVEEAQSAQACGEDDGARKPGHHACHFGVLVACSIRMVTCVDRFADDLACQEGPSGFGADDHLWASAEESVYEWVEDE